MLGLCKCFGRFAFNGPDFPTRPVFPPCLQLSPGEGRNRADLFPEPSEPGKQSEPVRTKRLRRVFLHFFPPFKHQKLSARVQRMVTGCELLLSRKRINKTTSK